MVAGPVARLEGEGRDCPATTWRGVVQCTCPNMDKLWRRGENPNYKPDAMHAQEVQLQAKATSIWSFKAFQGWWEACRQATQASKQEMCQVPDVTASCCCPRSAARRPPKQGGGRQPSKAASHIKKIKSDSLR